MLFLFRFIRNNFFPIFFLILLGTAITQVIRFNIYHQTFFFNTSKSVLNTTNQIQNSYTHFFSLSKANEQLMKENSDLRKLLQSNLLLIDTQKTVAKDSIGKSRYSYINCNVIKNSTMLRNNFITIDKGKSSGIQKGMGVISPAGIVGIVFDVSENFALVLSVLNSKFITTPMIPSINFREGSVSWNGANPELVQLNGVNKFEKLKKGMMVVTSNYSVKFPPGIQIGQIENIKFTKSSSFYSIDVKLSNDFRKLQSVYVVTDYYKSELDTLAVRETEQIVR